MSTNNDSRLNTQTQSSNEDELKRRQIRQLNDQLRKTLLGGLVVVTSGVSDLEENTRKELLYEIAHYSQFDHNNDPYNEHDFGRVKVEGHEILWKIDYYDLNMEYASSDPSDPSITTRVLTIMLAGEY